MSPHSRHLSHWWNSGREKKNKGWEGGEDAKWTTLWSEQCTKLPHTMWACTYGIDCWIPAELVGCLTAKLTNSLTAKFVNRLTAKLMNCLTAKLMNRLTAKLVDRLTAKLMVVNLVKLHLTKLNWTENLQWMKIKHIETFCSSYLLSVEVIAP